MQINLYYFDGCPSWKDALDNLKAALAAEEQEAVISLVDVQDEAVATQLKFLGSSSFRVDGVDLWSEERERYSLSCRVYATPQGMLGAPTVEMLREKLRLLNS